MKTLFAILLTLGMLAAAGFAQTPCANATNQSFCVAQVSNAASLEPWYGQPATQQSVLQNAPIAQGSYFSIFGNGLAANVSTCGTGYKNCLWAPYPLPTSIQGTSVSVTVGSTTVQAYIEFAAQITSTFAQINAVLPSTTPTGNGTLTVTYNGTASNAFPITVVPSSVGIFAQNQAGSGPGIITDVKYNVLTPFHTAKPGDYVLLWATGLGPAPDVGTEVSAPPTATNLCGSGETCPVTVWVGGQKAQVPYAGRSGYTAEDQIVFIVPSGVTGCYVSVAVQTTNSSGTVISNFTSMPVDPNGATCQDTDGVNYNDIASAVSSKGSANVGVADMLSNYLNLSIPALGATFQWDNDTISVGTGTYSSSVLSGFQGFALAPSVNNCSVSTFEAFPPPVDPELAAVTFLNAGSSLSIKNPSGTSSTIAQKGTGYFQLVGGSSIQDLLAGTGGPPFYLNASGWGTSSWSWQPLAGNYTLSGSGGSGTGAVGSFNLTIPVDQGDQSFKWTNQSTITAGPISRTSPLTITWSGGNPNGFVDITAISSTLMSGATPSNTTPGILVECIAPTSAGSFQIPTYVLQTLPSTTASTAVVPPGELLVGPASGAIKLTPPSGLDAFYAIYHFIEGANVSWQ